MSSESDLYADESYHDEPDDVNEFGYDTDEEEWEDEDEGIWPFWDEGIITLLIVGGAILFLFPEPVTSGIGILMLGFGVLMWLVDWAT